ncbi:Urease accessory protein UreD [Madurella fahalii]|uniref:Urease accessory protein UreD n=1 Tax=Madurella fahalii TaxID=1157608 RepID=A0ABQ0G8N2_9PEZI
MPHKHTRREKDESTFNLPPTQIAKPLPPTISSKKGAAAQKKANELQKQSGQKRKRGGADTDDAPRAFKRIMALTSGKKPRSGLDNGDAPEKKVKGKSKAAGKNGTGSASSNPTLASTDELKIRPGERLSEFSHRVDAALPVSGLVNKTVKNGKDPLGLKVRRTKKEKKVHNMYAEWREIDRKVKERREEELELAEEREMENEALGVSWKLELEARGKKKKGKRAKYIGEEAGPEGDPWAEIVKKRGEAKVGINDVAQAPPELKLPKKNLLVRGAAVAVEDIPKAAGSLRQREELQGIRQEVVASYRKMMSERRPAVGT